VSYPCLKAELPKSQPRLASSTQERVEEVVGEAFQATAGGSHLFLKEPSKRSDKNHK